jgi:twitching motility protein PilJ
MMNKTGMKIFKKSMIIVLLSSFVAGGLIGYLTYRDADAGFREKQLESIKRLAKISAVNLNKRKIESIGTAGNNDKDIILSLRAIRNVLDLNADAVKILRKKGNLSEILLSDDSEAAAGKSFDLWKEMNLSLRTGNATSRIFEKEGKEFVAGFAPIKGDSSGVVSLLMLEKDLSKQEPAILSFVVLPVMIVIILLLAAVIFIFFDAKKLQSGIDSIANFLLDLKDGEEKIPESDHGYCSELIQPLKSLQEKMATQKESASLQEKIQSQIKDLLKNVSAAANGDFTVQAKVTADTLGALADSFNLMVSDLSELIRDVKKAATKVNTATENILQNTNAMAGGAENQAAQTERITKSSKDMVNLLNKTNENAQRAAEAANKAKEVAERGGEIVKKSVQGMRIIRDSVQEASRQVKQLGENSKQISEITDFIVEIANRTNLLALNASIEAARAGEAGRGFTVVADEIRNLAERSSKSAEEISELVEDIQNGIIKSVKAMESGTSKVSEGTELVDSAGEILKEILSSVEISSSSIIDISKATHEQTEFSENIAKSLEEIAEIAKGTAERSKQSIGSVTELEFLSKTLNQAVEKFKLAQ